MKLINLARIDFAGTTGGKTKPEEVFDVQPTTADQTITPTEGSVFRGGTVRAVTKEIDVNIVSNNIKEGVTILGVAGTLKEEKPEESFDVQPMIIDQTITPTEGSVFSGGTVHAVTSAIDSNIQPENIKEGVTILGVAGTLSEGGGSSASIYDGSFDEDGLRAIGWTEDDIAYFEEANPHFASEDENYRVSEANKALYGKVTYENIRNDYKSDPNMVFVPKFDIPTTSNYFFPPFNNPNIIGIPSLDYSRLNKISTGSSGTSIFSYLRSNNIPPFNTPPNVTSLEELYSDSNVTAVDLRDTQNVTNMSGLFYGCKYLTSIKPINTQNVTDMSYMFDGCVKLKKIPQMSTSNVTNMELMFHNCTGLLSLPPLDTSNVTNMREFVSGCNRLKNISSLDTSKVTSMSYMFYECADLTEIPPLSASNVTYMPAMFYGCKSLTVIPPLDTSKAHNMEQLFYACYGLTTVEGIDFSGFTSNVAKLFGYDSDKSDVTRFIVNGKINVSISDSYSIKALKNIDYDSVKSILAAADRTDNTNAKELAFNRTMTDQNGELAALVSSCTSKGWTITGLTLQ